MICADEALSFYDALLAYEYKIQLSASANTSALTTEQKKWLMDVRNTCKNVQCLLDAYFGRIYALAAGSEDTESMEDPLTLVCDVERRFILVETRRQSDMSFFASLGYKTSEMEWSNLEITGDRSPDGDYSYRKGSRTRAQRCGDYEVKVEYGYLNANPMGRGGEERFPVVTLRWGGKLLVRKPFGDEVVACPDGATNRVFACFLKKDLFPHAFVEMSCYDEVADITRWKVNVLRPR